MIDRPSASPLPVAAPDPDALDVEVVVPVFNEEDDLERSVRRLHAFLSDAFPFTWRIVIADNASTDGTPQLAAALARELPGVVHLCLDRKGRGRALREAWTHSPARALAYMDVDLSTDLRALLPLVAPLLSGHSDVAIGSRLAHGSHVVRGPKRELISRTYNTLLRATLRARFTDAQCGFKAVSAAAARELVPEIRDDAWFFDTELLVLAQRRGMRIHEVPVDWVDDPDSRVDLVSTAMEDLRGIARLLLGTSVARFVAVGIGSTIAYALLFLVLRGPLGANGANALALALTAVGNTAVNRRFTFRVRGRAGLLRHHTMGFAVYLLTLGLTAGALGVLHGLAPHASHAVELAALVAANLAATITRYVALKTHVLRVTASARRAAAAPGSAPATLPSAASSAQRIR